MPRILVVQTTRMGDTLQTSPLIREIRRLYPDAHIAVMVRRMGKAIAERHPDVNEVIVYDEDEMFTHMRALDSDRYVSAYHTADKMIRQLKSAHFDIVYNATHSAASAMLIKLAEIPTVIGAHMSDDWQYLLRGRWTTYFFTSVFNREYSDLNLCDIVRHFSGSTDPCRELVFEIREEDRAFVRELLQTQGIGEADPVICMQLGASESAKRWAEERFAALAQELRARYQAKIILVGVKEEAFLGEAFERYAPETAVHLFGKTNLPQLGALLERSKLLVTNDTGTMHVAAAVRCPIVLVSVGHVHYRETGPFGEGHCAIEWRRAYVGRTDLAQGREEERTLLLPSQVMIAVEKVLAPVESFPCEQLVESEMLAPVDLFITRFAPDGCLEYYPVIRRALTERDFLRIAYRAMWLDHLGPHEASDREENAISLMLQQYEPPEKGQIYAWEAANAEAFEGIAAIVNEGILVTDMLLQVLEQRKSMLQARELVGQLTRLDEKSRVFGEIHPPCRPLALLARFERDNLEGMDPSPLARTTREIYASFKERALLMARKIHYVASLAQSREV